MKHQKANGGRIGDKKAESWKQKLQKKMPMLDIW